VRRGDVVTLCGDDPLLAQRVEVLEVLPDAKVCVRTGGGPMTVDRTLLSIGSTVAPMHRSNFEYADIKQTSAGKRRVELERAGLCEPAGFKRPSDTGDPAGVHRITTEGLRVWLAERQRWAS
jgi:hypothetical protein